MRQSQGFQSNQKALVAFTGHYILSELYPGQQFKFDTALQKQLSEYSMQLPPGLAAARPPLVSDACHSYVLKPECMNQCGQQKYAAVHALTHDPACSRQGNSDQMPAARTSLRFSAQSRRFSSADGTRDLANVDASRAYRIAKAVSAALEATAWFPTDALHHQTCAAAARSSMP